MSDELLLSESMISTTSHSQIEFDEDLDMYPPPSKRDKPDVLGIEGKPIESFNLSTFHSQVLHNMELNRSSNQKHYHRRIEIKRWMLTFVIGAATGLVGCVVALAVSELMRIKYDHILYPWLEEARQDQSFNLLNHLKMFGTFISLNLVGIFFAALLVVFIEPVAAGSGIAEVKCTLNGIKLPRVTHEP